MNNNKKKAAPICAYSKRHTLTLPLDIQLSRERGGFC